MDSRKSRSGKATRANLVIMPDKMGDLSIATPVYRAYKETFPDQPLHVLTGEVNADVVIRDPHIDRILRIPRHVDRNPPASVVHALLKEGGRYERATVLFPNWDGWNWLLATRRVRRVAQIGGTLSALLLGHARVLRNDFREGEVMLDLFLAVAARTGAVPSDRQPRLHVTEEEREAVARRFPFLTRGDGIFLHAFSVTAFSNLGPAAYCALGSYLAKKSGRPVYLLGTQTEFQKAALSPPPELNTELIGQLSIRELMAACTHAAVVVGGSSGVIHLAAALGAPTLGLYCPGDHHAQAWGPRGSWARTLCAPASLCRRMGAQEGPCGAPGFCDLGFAFPHEEVLLAIEEQIAAKGRPPVSGIAPSI